MIRCNFHTHTKYCDGHNTPEEMVQAAISKGFDAIGFSGHSHTAFDESYCMDHDAAMEYRMEVLRLRDEYEGQIEIYCGMEYDYYSDEPLVRDPGGKLIDWDYIIGSVHYVKKDRMYFPADENVGLLTETIFGHFDGDIYSFCEDYYETVADVVNKTGCDIVGHFDLVTKFNGFFDGADLNPDVAKLWIDESHPRYVAAYEKALKKIIADGAVIEVNTSAIGKFGREYPYPNIAILRRIYDMGGRIMINSDSHDVTTIDQHFEEVEKLVKEAGFDEVARVSKTGITMVEL